MKQLLGIIMMILPLIGMAIYSYDVLSIKDFLTLWAIIGLITGWVGVIVWLLDE